MVGKPEFFHILVTPIFGSERLTDALLDRLTHQCHILKPTEKATACDKPGNNRTGSPLYGRT